MLVISSSGLPRLADPRDGVVRVVRRAARVVAGATAPAAPARGTAALAALRPLGVAGLVGVVVGLLALRTVLGAVGGTTSPTAAPASTPAGSALAVARLIGVVLLVGLRRRRLLASRRPATGRPSSRRPSSCHRPWTPCRRRTACRRSPRRRSASRRRLRRPRPPSASRPSCGDGAVFVSGAWKRTIGAAVPGRPGRAPRPAAGRLRRGRLLAGRGLPLRLGARASASLACRSCLTPRASVAFLAVASWRRPSSPATSLPSWRPPSSPASRCRRRACPAAWSVLVGLVLVGSGPVWSALVSPAPVVSSLSSTDELLMPVSHGCHPCDGAGRGVRRGGSGGVRQKPSVGDDTLRVIASHE